MKIVVQTQIGKTIFRVSSINKVHGNEEHSGKETTQVKKCHEIKMTSKIQ